MYVQGFELDPRVPSYEISCEADGTLFEPKQGCVPVNCGELPGS